MIYPEFALVVWAARRVGRPVKWTCERQEAFVSDYQGRDLAVEAELALDADGNFLAMRGSNIGNAGARLARDPRRGGTMKPGIIALAWLPAAAAPALVSNTAFAQAYPGKSIRLIVPWPEEFAAKIKADIAKWGRVVKTSGASLE